MCEIPDRKLGLYDYNTGIYSRLVARGLAAYGLYSTDQLAEADYVIIDFAEDNWLQLTCRGAKVFALNATEAAIRKLMLEKEPLQVMGFVDYTSGLEFIYFWVAQLLLDSGNKQQLLEKFFPHQWERESCCLGLVNSLPLWSVNLLPKDLPVIVTNILPYSVTEKSLCGNNWIGRNIGQASLKSIFLVGSSKLQPMQRIFWLENVKVL